MGNNSGKKNVEEPGQKNLEELFVTISNKKVHILRDDLKTLKRELNSKKESATYDQISYIPARAWGSQIDQNLYVIAESYLFSDNHNELSSHTFKKFYFDICKEDIEKKVEVLFQLLGERNEIPGQKLMQFITCILNSVLIIQESKSPKKFSSWNSKITQKDRSDSVKVYGMFFLNQARKTDSDKFNKEDLQCLLTHLDYFLNMVLSRMYNTEDKHFYTNVIPKWNYGPVDSGKTLEEISILDLFQIIFLNLELPVDFQNEWRIIFSTKVHGESFSRLSAEIVNKGPTIILVKDKEGHIFGGFAPCSWSLGPTFFGDSRSFLFTLRPKMNLFVATYFNENYQYMNVGQQTMPNGLGMGGKLGYFGLWLDAEFGTGYCSESCTSYRNYKSISGSKDFEVSHLEVWGVGPPPPSAADLGERSVLDGNLEAKAILEMAGKTAYSEGLREDIEN